MTEKKSLYSGTATLYFERRITMTNGLIWAILGLGVGMLVTKMIENQYNNKKYLYLVLAIGLVAVIVFLKLYVKL